MAKDINQKDRDVNAVTDEILTHSKYVETIITKAFENDRDIGKDSDHFIQQALNSDKRCPIIFADYAHNLLTKEVTKNSNEEEFDKKVDEFFKLINKIYDKDVFLAESRFLLARRLLEKANIDSEKRFLGKMGTDWGLGDQAKMKNMLDDIATSDELMKEWKTIPSYSGPDSIELNAKILRVSCWPDKLFIKDKDQGAKIFTSDLDDNLGKLKDNFKNFYSKKNSGKSLNWVINYGSAEIKVQSEGKSYFLNTTIGQMAVLLLFNKNPVMKYSFIKEALGFEDDASLKLAQEALRQFSQRFKLISWKRDGQEVDKDKIKVFQDDDEFTVMKTFKNERFRLNCIPTTTSGVKREENKQNDTEPDVMKEREFIIDATVVRIMKSRRELSLIDLQQEAKKLITLFAPDPKLIKRRIDSLMERDYLERHATKNNVFIYKP